MTSTDESSKIAGQSFVSEGADAADIRPQTDIRPRLMPRSLVPAARMAYHSWHYARWSWRFGGFGFGSTLGKPRVALAHYPKVFIGHGVHLGPLWRLEALSGDVRGHYNRGRIEIGDETVADIGFHVGSLTSVVIGREVLIASWVLIVDANTAIRHRLPPRFAPFVEEGEAVHIGDGCWLGERSVIVAGVELGERCVVGANAVVTKSFPAYSIVAGIPAQLIGSSKPDS
jgi:acetyltransferase-like isoleucine patch superfamily enzyme